MFLAFIGLTDVEYVFIEGQAYGPEVATQQKAAADARVEALLA
jgi:FMN-dependent NADH-azoreductase